MEYEDKIKALVEILKSGEKIVEDFKIGVEIEHIVVDKDSLDSINYYQENGIEETLKKLMKFNYKPKYENNYLIGLEKEAAILTLEPGGQLEISIKPCSSIQEVERIYLSFLQEVTPILEEQNQLLMAIGYHPKSSILEIPFNPKKRYELMSSYLKTKGSHAHNMMKGTAALQVTIDYRNEEDFIKKIRVANFLSPIFAYISDNGPIFEGRLFDKYSIRSLIWENTDPSRSGIIDGVMDKEVFGYREYAEYLLGVAPILIIKDNSVISTLDKKTGELMDEYSFTKDELMHIMTMVFPDVRAKRYLEIRMGDSIPYPYNLSYISLIKAIFYNEAALNELYQLSLNVNSVELSSYKSSMMEKGSRGEFLSKTVGDIIAYLIDLARSSMSEEEQKYFEPLAEILSLGENISLLLREGILEKGPEALKWCSLNALIQEGKYYEDKRII